MKETEWVLFYKERGAKMYKVIYMKADYEPWWQFEGWQDYVVSESIFDCKMEAEGFLQKMLADMSLKYTNKRHNKDRFWAFWSEEESGYCEQCADDAQIYHGLIWLDDE